MYPVNGKVHHVANNETAWWHRDVNWSMVIAGIAEDAKQNGKTNPNSYEFLWHPWMNDDPKIKKSAWNNGSAQGRTLLPVTEDYGSGHEWNHSSDPYKENHIKENQRRENTHEREFSSNDVENIFKVYPRKAAYAAGIKEIVLAVQRLKNRKDIDFLRVRWVLFQPY